MKITQDALLGSLFVAVGATALIIALDYPIGSAGRMGPGYFPVIVATLLTVVGLGILLRARMGASEPITVARWLPVVVVSAAIVLFGLMIERLGLPAAVFLLCAVAALASVKFELAWKPIAGAAAFAAFCGLLFVRLLGLPLPIVGTWLQPLFGS